MAIVVPHQIRRGTAGVTDLQDLTAPVSMTDDVPAYVQSVPDHSMHAYTSFTSCLLLVYPAWPRQTIK
jgi:hypothetical protein